MPTTPTQMRLTELTKVQLAEIQNHYGLPSLASTVRYLIEREYARLSGEFAEKSRKKSKRGA